MPEPNFFTGPLLSDAERAAAAGATLGGVGGFFISSLRHSMQEVEQILMWTAYSAALVSFFGVALVLFGHAF